MKSNNIILIFLLLNSITMKAQKVVEFEININQVDSALSIPVCIDLDEITKLPSENLSLFKNENGKLNKIISQIKEGEHRYLYWFLDREDLHETSIKYQIKTDTSKYIEKNKIILKDNDGKIVFEKSNKPILAYQYKTLFPPEGIDLSYKRSGFIHPVYSPHGQILTQIQPKDHYHHYGIWNPWTHVLFESDTVDFWNLAKLEGTVKFDDIVSFNEGQIFSEIKVHHKHVVFKKNGLEKNSLNELQTIRIYNSENPESYIVDLIFEMSCATDSPVKLLEYRYGGLGWRATEKWDQDNSEVLTSEGNTRKDADGSLAKWCVIQGEIDKDYAGIEIMSFPNNYNHPEPLRIWPLNQNERGDVFANFSPTKNMDWELIPGKTYVLKYRLLVFNGKLTKDIAENEWHNFANILHGVK
ncbi:MAG: PmoA family protein [Ignavibacteriales bacterium]|nr:PmoA family protein [Ignavibacteriales bacterium]